MMLDRSPLKIAAAALLSMLSAAPVPAAAIRTAASPDGQSVEVRVEPFKPFASGVLELIDPASGRVLRAIRAGALSGREIITISPGPDAPPGAYRLRYREGLSIVPTGEELKRPDARGRRWNNPADLFVAADAFYVLDGVRPMLQTKPEHLTPRAWSRRAGEPITGRFVMVEQETLTIGRKEGDSVAVKLAELADGDRQLALRMERERQAHAVEVLDNVPRLYRLKPDGAADTGFGEAGCVTLPQDRFYDLRGFAVDPAGRVYFSDTYHSARVLDETGKRVRRNVGGWDNNPGGPKCTGWLNGLVCGPGNRLYMPTGFGNMKVYDYTRNGFEGVLSSTPTPARGYDRNVAIDVVASRGPAPTPQSPTTLYFIAADNSITRYKDDGTTIKAVHTTPAPVKLAALTGGWASAGLVWAADYGPSPGPFWDSGGGGEVLLFWDDGEECRLVERFGQPGPIPGEPETPEMPRFMNPSSIHVTPDHAMMWVVEGGQRYAEGPGGNARVRRFRINAAGAEEATIELKAK